MAGYSPFPQIGAWNIDTVTADSSFIPMQTGLGIHYSAEARDSVNQKIQRLRQQRNASNIARSRLTSEYQSAYNAAKAANEQRYQKILTGYKTRYSTAMTGLKTSRAAITGKLASTRSEVLGGLEGLGDEELAGIGRQYTKERASAAQGLISSGLHSTTVAPAVQAGVTRREGYATGEATERHRRERLGYVSQLGAQELEAMKQLSDRELLAQTGLTKDQLDFMERREDEYPSESLYVQLMQGLGSS